MDDELLDLVDKSDAVIGTINRKDYKQLVEQNLGYIRAVDLFILNSRGQLYIPIRTANKTIAPNGFDYSVGGHVEAGDDYLPTLMREAEEELNLDLTGVNLELVVKDIDEVYRYWRCLYIMHSDKTPEFNPNDFVSAEWLFPQEVIDKIDAGHPTKKNLRDSLVLVQAYLKDHQ